MRMQRGQRRSQWPGLRRSARRAPNNGMCLIHASRKDAAEQPGERWVTMMVTGTRPAGGTESALPPHCRIFSIAQKRLEISTRSLHYLPQHQFDVGLENDRKIRSEVFEKTAFLWRHASPFWSKNGKCLKAARIFSFEVIRNHRAPNGVKSNVLQNGYLGFLINFNFDAKTPIIDFSKIIANKIHFFKYIQNKISKKHILSKYIHATSIQNFKVISLFLAVQRPKHQTRVMTSLLWNAFFGVSKC